MQSNDINYDDHDDYSCDKLIKFQRTTAFMLSHDNYEDYQVHYNFPRFAEL